MDNLLGYLAGLITAFVVVLGVIINRRLRLKKPGGKKDGEKNNASFGTVITSVDDAVGGIVNHRTGDSRHKARDIISGLFSDYSDNGTDDDVRSGNGDGSTGSQGGSGFHHDD